MEARTHRALGVALVVMGLLAQGAYARAPGHACARHRWLGAWSASQTDAAPDPYSGRTLRINLTPLFPGDRVRVRLSNRFGAAALVVDRALIGRQLSGPSLVPGSNRPLRFDGRRKVTIPPGRKAVSDPVALEVRALRPVAVSVHVSPSSKARLTRHYAAMQSTWAAPASAGDVAGSERGSAFAGGEQVAWRPLVSRLEVRAPGTAGAVVAFGDSITDGVQAPDDGGVGRLAPSHRYPDFLARRLAGRAGPQTLSVLNAGIAGNLLLGASYPEFGPSGLSRLGRDVIR